jgi:hypothetical protein
MRKASAAQSKRRPQKSARRALDDMRRKLLAIEVPLNDAIDYVNSLRLIGHGLIADHDDAGRPIVAVALAAGEGLDKVKNIWNRIHKIDPRRVPDRRRHERA